MTFIGLLFAFSANADLVRCDNLDGGVAVSPDGKFTSTDSSGVVTPLVPEKSGSNVFKLKNPGMFSKKSGTRYFINATNKDGKPAEVIIYTAGFDYTEEHSYKLDYSSSGECYVKSVSDVSVKDKETILYDTVLCKKMVDEFKGMNLTETEVKKCSGVFQKMTSAMDEYRNKLSSSARPSYPSQRIWSDLVDKEPIKSALLFMSKCREQLGNEPTAFAHFELPREPSDSKKSAPIKRPSEKVAPAQK